MNLPPLRGRGERRVPVAPAGSLVSRTRRSVLRAEL